MIQVSHESHIISPSFELDNTLQYFGAVAYLAKDSGNNSLFNQAKEQYQSLADKWYTQAKSEAERKSHKNWLGGGVTYTVTSPMKFETMIDFPLVRIFSQLPKENRIKALEYLLRVKSPGFHTLSEAYQYAERTTIIDSIKKEQIDSCGINKNLKEEKEKQEEKERINKRQREIFECEQHIAQQKRQEKERQEKEAYITENSRILTTNEYKSVYSLFEDAFNAYESNHQKKAHLYIFLPILITILIPIICIPNGLEPDDPRDWGVLAGLCFIAEIAALIWGWLNYSKDGLEEYLSQYMKNRNDYDKELVTSSMIRDVSHAGNKDYQGSHAAREYLSQNIVIAYRKKYNLPVNYKWHT